VRRRIFTVGVQNFEPLPLEKAVEGRVTDAMYWDSRRGSKS
jgi:hypothetical protein